MQKIASIVILEFMVSACGSPFTQTLHEPGDSGDAQVINPDQCQGADAATTCVVPPEECYTQAGHCTGGGSLTCVSDMERVPAGTACTTDGGVKSMCIGDVFGHWGCLAQLSGDSGAPETGLPKDSGHDSGSPKDAVSEGDMGDASACALGPNAPCMDPAGYFNQGICKPNMFGTGYVCDPCGLPTQYCCKSFTTPPGSECQGGGTCDIMGRCP